MHWVAVQLAGSLHCLLSWVMTVMVMVMMMMLEVLRLVLADVDMPQVSHGGCSSRLCCWPSHVP
jgi:hypothetical protein